MDHSIQLPDELVMLLKSDIYSNQTRVGAIHDFISNILGEFYQYLRAYQSDEARGTICDDSLELVDLENDGVEFSAETGIFHITFSEEAWYGCRDMNNFHEHEENIPFTIDLDSNLFIAHFYNQPYRDDEI